jgi:hypothetical protein
METVIGEGEQGSRSRQHHPGHEAEGGENHPDQDQPCARGTSDLLCRGGAGEGFS